MRIEELQNKGAIYFSNIQEGMEGYREEKYKFTEEEALDYFGKLMITYGKSNVYVDFYYPTLPEEAKEKVRSVLSLEEQSYIETMEKELIFPLDEMLLRIIVKLNAEEILFSTLYFLQSKDQPRMTWWGNYEKEYYCFRD